ncbi:hypothetical protein EYF80_038389 [Liparis tanakae]|uniref:Uncharacterized protein n=1 Tax=Liparis tanakae TaxID=230148 RepID=A0A4Z2GCW5_9TELE|nr:hypothetical protein EYF80_038389 [Liparis tanakae]
MRKAGAPPPPVCYLAFVEPRAIVVPIRLGTSGPPPPRQARAIWAAVALLPDPGKPCPESLGPGTGTVYPRRAADGRRSKVSTFSYVLFCLPGISSGVSAGWPARPSDRGVAASSSRDAHLLAEPPPPYHRSESAGERVRGATAASPISGSSPARTSLMVLERLTTSLISAMSLSLRAHSSPLLPTDPGRPPAPPPPAPILLLLFLLRLGDGPLAVASGVEEEGKSCEAWLLCRLCRASMARCTVASRTRQLCFLSRVLGPGVPGSRSLVGPRAWGKEWAWAWGGGGVGAGSGLEAGEGDRGGTGEPGSGPCLGSTLIMCLMHSRPAGL